MKVKLLRKVRKEFSIIHTPPHFKKDGDFCPFDTYTLKFDEEDAESVLGMLYYDNLSCQLKVVEEELKQDFDKIITFNTEKECIEYLKSKIIEVLKYRGYKSRKDINRQNKFNNSKRKVWYNP